MSSTRSPITTHVLDLASGRPGKGIRVLLRVKESRGAGGAEGGGGRAARSGAAKRAGTEEWREIGRGVTGADGRAMSLMPPGATISAGTYQLRFDTLFYFKENLSSPSSSFFSEVVVTFEVTDPSAHYHVPLLLSPFGYSTYRGS